MLRLVGATGQEYSSLDHAFRVDFCSILERLNKRNSYRRIVERGSVYALGTKNRIVQKVSAATTAEAGMVSTQAQTICLATPHRTAERREVDPTPTIAPVMVCVVLTGMPW